MEIFSASPIVRSDSVYLTLPVILGGSRSSRAARHHQWLSVPSRLFLGGSRNPLGLVDLGSRWFPLDTLAPPALYFGCSQFLLFVAFTPLLSGCDTLTVWAMVYLFILF
jgi:hypothetical protein